MYLDVHDMLSLTKKHPKKMARATSWTADFFESLELAVDNETTLYVPDPFR